MYASGYVNISTYYFPSNLHCFLLPRSFITLYFSCKSGLSLFHSYIIWLWSVQKSIILLCVCAQIYNVEVGEDVSFCVLLVDLLDIGSYHHQQLQMCDIRQQSWSTQTPSLYEVKKYRREIVLIALYLSLKSLHFCDRETYLRRQRENQERKLCPSDWRSDEKA